jgi:hypothetical protein
MTRFPRFFFLYLPGLILLGIALIHFKYNQKYPGESLSSMPAGEYSVVGIRCAEANLLFDYVNTIPDQHIKDRELMKDFLYFDGEIDRRFIIDDKSVTFVTGNRSCSRFERTNIFQNDKGKFSYSGVTMAKIVPAGCSLPYTYKGVTYNEQNLVGTQDTEPALSNERMKEHLIYRDNGLFFLYEVGLRDYSGFGCKAKDSLTILLAKLNS